MNVDSPRTAGRLERILTLLKRIGGGAYLNADRLAEELGVSRRTIFRDIRLLRSVGVTIRIDEPAKGYEVHKLNHLDDALSGDDALELIAHAQASVLPCSGSQRKRVERAIRRLRSKLPAEQKNVLEQIKVMSVEQRGGLSERERIDTLVAAVYQKTAVTIHLVDGTGYSEPEVEVAPVRIEFRIGRWVLDAVRLRDHAKMRIVLCLIDDIETGDQPITPPLSERPSIWTEPDIAITQSIRPSDD